MKVAFTLFRYFPYGGLQRDLFAVAAACAMRGHDVTVLTQEWQGAVPAGVDVVPLPVTGRSNHVRARRFAAAAAAWVAHGQPDLVVGFDRMPGLDLYFAADTCFLEKAHGERSAAYRLTPRYRQFAAFERAVFGPASTTRILLLDPRQEPVYRRWYGTLPERFVHLPPGIARDRRPGPDAAAERSAGRAEFGLAADDHLLLLLGSDFRRKGFDRALRAMAALPDDLAAATHMLVVGADDPRPLQKLARRLGVGERVRFPGARDDVPRLLQAADLLLHPARLENTGTVLLEALAAGLPVLTTASCGYARHVGSAAAGEVLGEPFRQPVLDMALARLLRADREALRRRALAWAAGQDLHGLHSAALAAIEASLLPP